MPIDLKELQKDSDLSELVVLRGLSKWHTALKNFKAAKLSLAKAQLELDLATDEYEAGVDEFAEVRAAYLRARGVK